MIPLCRRGLEASENVALAGVAAVTFVVVYAVVSAGRARSMMLASKRRNCGIPNSSGGTP